MKPLLHNSPRLARWAVMAFTAALLLIAATQASGAPASGVAPAWGVAPAAPDAQTGVQSSGLTLDALAGFDGLCKDQSFIPLTITVENNGPAFEGEVLVSAPNFTGSPTLYTYPLQLTTTARKELHLAVYPETYINELDVRLRMDKKIVLAQKVPVRCLAPDQVLVGVLAGNPSALNALAEYPSSNQDASLARLGFADLPEQAQYLESLDVLLVSDLDTGALKPAQMKAIEGWLASGGQLLVMGGAGWQKSAAGLGSLLPFQPDGLSEIADLSPLGSFAHVEEAPASTALAATGVLAPGATLLLSQGSQPLAASRPVGYGRVLYLVFDLASEPLRSWSGAPQLLNALLEPAPARPSWASGFTDAYQAASAIQTLPSLRLVGVGWLLVFLIFYTLSIGPLNYLILRLTKRRELAWVTIPLLALVFAAGAFLVGGRSRGALPVLSRLSFVQVWSDQAGGLPEGQPVARLDGLLGVFSPTRQSYALDLPPGLSLYPLRDANMQPPTGGYQLTVAEDGSLSMPSVRLDVAEVLGQAVGGMIPAPQLDQDLRLVVDAGTAGLEGKITNNSGVRLENVILLAPGWSQPYGDLEPGAELVLEVDFQSASGATSTTVPFKPAGGGPYYSYPIGVQSLDMLVGGSDYYSDAALFRRFSLLSAIAGYNVDLTQAGGYFLAAWSSQPAFDATLDQRFATDDLTFYLFALQPELASKGDKLTLPPALFRWSLPEGSPYYGADRSPYTGYLSSSDPFFFDYQLAQPLNFAVVDELTLHLKGERMEGGDKSLVLLEVSLWDYTSSAWHALEPLPFGDHAIANPGRFVGPGGALRIRLDNPDEMVPIQLRQVDFTLQVLRSAP